VDSVQGVTWSATLSCTEDVRRRRLRAPGFEKTTCSTHTPPKMSVTLYIGDLQPGNICGVSIVHPPHSSVVRYWHVSSISVPEVCSESTTEDSFDRRIYRCMTAEGEVPPYHCTARMLGFVPGEFNRLSPDTSWYLCSIDPESTCMYVFPFCVLLRRSSFSGT
jgi:hypothetical protein